MPQVKATARTPTAPDERPPASEPTPNATPAAAAAGDD